MSSRIINTSMPIDYNVSCKSKKWDVSSEMHERRLFLKVQPYFISMDSSFSNEGVLGRNEPENTPRMKSMETNRDRSSEYKVKIINPDNVKVAPKRQKNSRTEILTTPSKVSRKSAKQSYIDEPFAPCQRNKPCNQRNKLEE